MTIRAGVYVVAERKAITVGKGSICLCTSLTSKTGVYLPENVLCGRRVGIRLLTGGAGLRARSDRRSAPPSLGICTHIRGDGSDEFCYSV